MYLFSRFRFTMAMACAASFAASCAQAQAVDSYGQTRVIYAASPFDPAAGCAISQPVALAPVPYAPEPAASTAMLPYSPQPVTNAAYVVRHRRPRRVVVVHRRPWSHSAAIVGGSALAGAGIGALAGGGHGAIIGGLVGGAGGLIYDRKTHKKRRVVYEH